MTEARSMPKAYEALPGPPGLPLVGNLFQLRLDTLHDTLERWAERYGPFYRVHAGPMRMAVLSDAKTVRRLLRERVDRFRPARNVEALASDVHMRGVIANTGDEWRRQQRIVVRALRTGTVRPFFPALAVVVARLRRRWEGAADRREPVDLCGDLQRVSADALTSFVFGGDCNTLETPGPPIRQRLDKAIQVVHKRTHTAFPYWRYLRLPADRTFDRTVAQLREEVASMVREARERRRAEPARRTAPASFVEEAVAADEAQGAELSDDEIFDNVFAVLLAGEEAVAYTVAWVVYCLVRHPEHLPRIRAEVDAAIAPAAAVEKIEQLSHLPFLDAFLNEVMRLKSIAPMNSMQPVEEAEVLGHLIPRDVIIMTLNRYLGTRDAHFAHASRFDPNRWLAGGPRSGCPHDTSTFLPFGAGARFCPGRNLGLLQVRTVLAMLCRNFDVELADPKRPVGEKLLFAVKPTNLIVRLKRRTS